VHLPLTLFIAVIVLCQIHRSNAAAIVMFQWTLKMYLLISICWSLLEMNQMALWSSSLLIGLIAVAVGDTVMALLLISNVSSLLFIVACDIGHVELVIYCLAYILSSLLVLLCITRSSLVE